MRIIHGILSLALVVPACGSPNNTQDPGPTSSRPAPAIDAQPETALERAAAKITDATKGVTKGVTKSVKPTKPAKRKHVEPEGDGGEWNQQPASEPPPKKEKKELPETGRHIGEECDRDDQCVSQSCTFERCDHKTNTRLPKGEKCDYANQCESDNCYDDTCQ